MKVIYNNGSVGECAPEEELHIIRHTAAHIMAQAIKRLYPQADFAYGPATDNGFYYDVDLGDAKISDEDLEAIEKEMRKICKENLPIRAFTLSREEAKKLMEERQEKYKLEHIDDLPEDAVISIYQQGEYIDMCVGPHLTYTKALSSLPAFPVLTGKRIRTTRCLPASTVLLSAAMMNWTLTLRCLKKLPSVTTERSAAR